MTDSGVMIRLLWLLAVLECGCPLDTGMLYPRETSSREVKELNGLWKFRADMSPNRNQGFERAWYKTQLEEVNKLYSTVTTLLFNTPCVDCALQIRVLANVTYNTSI